MIVKQFTQQIACVIVSISGLSCFLLLMGNQSPLTDVNYLKYKELYGENGYHNITQKEYTNLCLLLLFISIFIIDSCSHFSGYFYTTRKDRAVNAI